MIGSSVNNSSDKAYIEWLQTNNDKTFNLKINGDVVNSQPFKEYSPDEKMQISTQIALVMKMLISYLQTIADSNNEEAEKGKRHEENNNGIDISAFMNTSDSTTMSASISTSGHLERSVLNVTPMDSGKALDVIIKLFQELIFGSEKDLSNNCTLLKKARACYNNYFADEKSQEYGTYSYGQKKGDELLNIGHGLEMGLDLAQVVNDQKASSLKTANYYRITSIACVTIAMIGKILSACSTLTLFGLLSAHTIVVGFSAAASISFLFLCIHYGRTKLLGDPKISPELINSLAKKYPTYAPLLDKNHSVAVNLATLSQCLKMQEPDNSALNIIIRQESLREFFNQVLDDSE